MIYNIYSSRTATVYRGSRASQHGSRGGFEGQGILPGTWACAAHTIQSSCMRESRT